MAKLDIDIVLIDESVVLNGFRVLMAGARLDAFKANPVMLFMHNRAEAMFNPADNNLLLAIGRWYDIRIENGRLLAKPDFDDDDDFALKIQRKVEKGYYNAASIWIEPIAVSDDTALQSPGQRGPTLTEWGIFEASIVDIPNCRGALAIRNSAGKMLTLSAMSTTPEADEVLGYLRTLIPEKQFEMDNKLLAAKLGLPETATEADLSTKLTAVLDASVKLTQMSAENTTLKGEIVKLKSDADKARNEALVDGGIAAKKFPAGDRDKYMKLAAADFDTTKELIDAMKPYESVETRLSQSTATNALELEGLLKLSGRELYLDGKLERLKELSPEHFKLKYKEAFGIEYKG